MGVRLNNFPGTVSLSTMCLSAATLVASSMVFTEVAVAQNATQQPSQSAAEQESVLEAFEDAFYRRTGNFYRNRGVPGNITWFIGPFPENTIAADARAINRVYQDVMTFQTLSDPLIRTADLVNPFETSLLLLPTTQPAVQPQERVEFVPVPVAPATTPAARPAAPTGPVRALF